MLVKPLVYPLLFISVTALVSDMSRQVLSSHILDTSTGRPAAGVFVELYKKRENSWTLWHNTTTNGDGRISFPFTKESMAAGIYKLVFNVEEYYKRTETETIYPHIEVSFLRFFNLQCLAVSRIRYLLEFCKSISNQVRLFFSLGT